MENTYLEKKLKKDCNGCGICTLCCPVDAINMVEDSEGYLYPVIDEAKCIKCNKCKKICSNYNDCEKTKVGYMAVNKNKEDLKRSASGGIFYILAKYVTQNNGVVFGVEYGQNHKVQHNYYETLEECQRFQGSKYVRSDIGDSYKKTEEFLKQGRFVLFTGTPCQCNGLKTYLGKDYEKLIICDIICFANPSQKIFDKYIKDTEIKENKKIEKINFRDKANGWKNGTPIIYFEDGSKLEDQSFHRGFIAGIFDRPSCHECKFSSTARITDFTLGDFWGIDKVMPDVKDDNTGISIMTVNTQKAKAYLEEIKDEIELIPVDPELGFSNNHHSNIKPHKNRKRFFKNFELLPVGENIRVCLKVGVFTKAYRKISYTIEKIMHKF